MTAEKQPSLSYEELKGKMKILKVAEMKAFKDLNQPEVMKIQKEIRELQEKLDEAKKQHEEQEPPKKKIPVPKKPLGPVLSQEEMDHLLLPKKIKEVPKPAETDEERMKMLRENLKNAEKISDEKEVLRIEDDIRKLEREMKGIKEEPEENTSKDAKPKDNAEPKAEEKEKPEEKIENPKGKFDTQKLSEDIIKEIAEREIKKGTPLSLEEKNEIGLQMYLKAKEGFQKETIESSGRFKRVFVKTEKWWSETLEQTKWGKTLKVAMSVAFIGSATLLAASGLDIVPTTGLASTLLSKVGLAVAPTTGIAVNLLSRVGLATGINMAVTSNLPGKFFGMFKKENNAEQTAEGAEEKVSKWKKYLTIGNITTGLSLGAAFFFSGGLVGAIAVGGVVGRKAFNAYFDKRIKEREEELKKLSEEVKTGEANEVFDINALVGKLDTFGQKYDDISKSLGKTKWGREITNGALTIGVGLGTMEAIHHNMGVENAEAKHQEDLKHQSESRHQQELKQQEELKAKIEEQFKIQEATVGKGQGIEHVLRHQLETNAVKFGFKGDITDNEALREWSGAKAHLIALDKNYVGADGKEVWIKDMGPSGPEGNPAYVLDVDKSGNTIVTEYFGGKPSGTGAENNEYEYEHVRAENKIGSSEPIRPMEVESLKTIPVKGITDHIDSIKIQPIATDVEHSVTVEKTDNGTITRESASGTVRMTPEIERQQSELAARLMAKNIDEETLRAELAKIKGAPLSRGEELSAKNIIGSQLATDKLGLLIQQMILDKQAHQNNIGETIEHAKGSVTSTGEKAAEYAPASPKLSIEALAEQVKDTHTNNINHLINSGASSLEKENIQNIIKEGEAKVMMEEETKYPQIQGYMKELQKITDLKPRGATLTEPRAETIDEYINRAEIEAARLGKLDNIKLNSSGVVSHIEKSTSEKLLEQQAKEKELSGQVEELKKKLVNESDKRQKTLEEINNLAKQNKDLSGTAKELERELGDEGKIYATSANMDEQLKKMGENSKAIKDTNSEIEQAETEKENLLKKETSIKNSMGARLEEENKLDEVRKEIEKAEKAAGREYTTEEKDKILLKHIPNYYKNRG